MWPKLHPDVKRQFWVLHIITSDWCMFLDNIHKCLHLNRIGVLA